MTNKERKVTICINIDNPKGYGSYELVFFDNEIAYLSEEELEGKINKLYNFYTKEIVNTYFQYGYILEGEE